MKKIIIVTILAAMLLNGCATIMNDATHNVKVSSNVPTASYTIRNKQGFDVQTGVAPSAVNLNVASGAYSGEKYTVSFTKDGYYPTSVILDSEVSGWWFGNILCFGGILGFAVIDPITGKMWTLPDNINGNLTPLK